jgi:hypothetical protein
VGRQSSVVPITAGCSGGRTAPPLSEVPRPGYRAHAPYLPLPPTWSASICVAISISGCIPLAMMTSGFRYVPMVKASLLARCNPRPRRPSSRGSPSLQHTTFSRPDGPGSDHRTSQMLWWRPNERPRAVGRNSTCSSSSPRTPALEMAPGRRWLMCQHRGRG